MEFIIKVGVDYDQVKDRENEISAALVFAVSGAMHQFKDGENRHDQTIDYEIFVDWEI